MSDLSIQARPSVKDEFYLALQYDSRNYSVPFPFDAYQIFLNNDKNPFVTLIINQKKIWQEQIDLTKYLEPGTYTLKLRTVVWTNPGNKTSATFVLKVGEFMTGGIYPGPTPPPSPPDPFPKWEEYQRYQEAQSAKGMLEEHWDQWTVDYGV